MADPLSQERCLFHRGQVRAIDLDDCGWGHFASDLAVTLSELRWRPGYAARRDALLGGYRVVRSLPADHERHLQAFYGLRTLLLILWFIEQRGHPSVPAWEREVRDGVTELATIVRGESVL